MKVLLIDTCGAVGVVALAEGNAELAAETLAARESSAMLLPAVLRLLAARGWSLAELDGVGVINGPGSFTGVRAGLAAAKGLCEAAGLRMTAISRLAVLAGSDEVCAVLDAGRGEFYVRRDAEEFLCGLDALREVAAGLPMVVAEEKLLGVLEEFRPELVKIGPEAMLPLVLAGLATGGSDAALVDANYVRNERQIYGRQAAA